MCTVILAWRVHPDVPLIVAANRDEFYIRPSAPPAALSPTRFGPTDLRAGGTWMASNRAGVVAALTNAVPPDLAPVDGVASRGEIIGRALRHRTAAAAAASVTDADPARTRPFYLLFAGPDGAHAVSATQESWSLTELEPGVHVQENRPRSVGGEGLTLAGAHARPDAVARRRAGPAAARGALGPRSVTARAAPPVCAYGRVRHTIHLHRAG